MDKRIIAYARIERVKDENVLWLGIQNNGNEPLIINEDKDHLYLELADGETVEIPAGDFKYVDRKKQIKKDENQQIKVTLSGPLAHLTAGGIGAITFSIASNLPEIIVLKQLPDKEKQMMSVALPAN